jgi:hypothetical protein
VLYRLLGTSSRAELMARALKRSWEKVLALPHPRFLADCRPSRLRLFVAHEVRRWRFWGGMVPAEESATRTLAGRRTMKIKTKMKSGVLISNHNLRVKTGVKSGITTTNHNQRLRTA